MTIANFAVILGFITLFSLSVIAIWTVFCKVAVRVKFGILFLLWTGWSDRFLRVLIESGLLPEYSVTHLVEMIIKLCTTFVGVFLVLKETERKNRHP